MSATELIAISGATGHIGRTVFHPYSRSATRRNRW